MERYLITQSLLSAWAYTFDCFEGCEEDAMSDFLRTLRREKSEPTEAMKNGIEFENLVYSIAAGAKVPAHKWLTGAGKVAEIIKGAPVQVRLSSEIEVDGTVYLLYGILDALKAGTIYDVKFLNSRMGSADLYGKYLTSAQHPAYFYLVPEAKEFKYLVSDGEDIYIETYQRGRHPFIGDIIGNFIRSIATDGLLDVYKEHWLAK